MVPVRSLPLAALIAVFVAVPALAQSGGGYVIRKGTIDSGGHGPITGGAYRVNGTVGQHDASMTSGGGYVLTGGFWSPTLSVSSVNPPLPEPGLGCRKNRYISFVPNNAATPVNFRVTHVPSGTIRWAVQAAPPSTPPGSLQWVTGEGLARLQTSPPPLVAWNFPVVHVGDCMIQPGGVDGQEYLVQATTDNVMFSPALSLRTIKQPAAGKNFGDCVGTVNPVTCPDLAVNFNDVTAGVRRYQNVAGAPHVTLVDLHPQTDPNAVCNFDDISRIVFGFQGKPITFAAFLPIAPAACP